MVYSLAGRQACPHHKPGPRSAATPWTPSPAAGSGRSGTWRWSCCLWRLWRWSQCCQRSNWWDTKTAMWAAAMWTHKNCSHLILLIKSALPSPRAGSLPTVSGAIFSIKADLRYAWNTFMPSMCNWTSDWVRCPVTVTLYAVPVNDQTPPLGVCGIRRWSRPAVVYYDFKSETKHIMIKRQVRKKTTDTNNLTNWLLYLLLRPFASIPIKTSEPISEASMTYGASLA